MSDALAGFGSRLAYARWLKHLADGDAPTNADIGRACERTGQWLTPWTRSVKAPGDDVREPMSKYLRVPPAWLFEGNGAAPEPKLWEVWARARDARQAPAAKFTRASATVEEKKRAKRA